jgi:hypothetical protein
MGSSPEREKMEKERGERARLGGGMEVAALGRAAGHLLGLLCSCVLSVPLLQFAAFVLLVRRRKQHEGEEKKEKKKNKRRKEKEKNGKKL